MANSAEKCPKCEGEYRNLGVHLKMAHKEPEGQVPGVGFPGTGNEPPQNPDEIKKDPAPEKAVEGDVMGMLNKIMGAVSAIDKRVDAIESEKKNDHFMKGVKSEDVASAKMTRDNIDPKIGKMVDEVLGEDFKISIEPRGDQPGFLFTVIVPARLSDVGKSTRPVRDPDGKGYLKTPEGTNVEEEYQPEDRRSRAIASYQSYDAIREHCERVRSYIVAYYQKMQKPIPEFKLKSYV